MNSEDWEDELIVPEDEVVSEDESLGSSNDPRLGSLPIVDSQKVPKCPPGISVTWAHVRIKTQLDMPAIKAHVKTYVEQRSVERKFIIGVESAGTPAQHYHIAMPWMDPIDKVGTWLRHLDEGIKGNKCFSASWKRKDTLFSYVVKQKMVVYEGFTIKEIEDFHKLSYTKYKKEEFVKKLQDITDDYLLSKISLKAFIKRFILLKAEYKQIIDLNYIQKYATMVEIKKDPKAAEHHAEYVFWKITDPERNIKK